MGQNLIDLELSPEMLVQIDAALTQLETLFSGLISPPITVRKRLTKMGDKSEAFCRQAVDVFTENPGVLSRNFDLESFQGDLAALDALRPRLMRITRLYERASGSELALGSDLMNNALEGYAHLKIAGKSDGLNALQKMLAARFAHRAGTADDEQLPSVDELNRA